MAKYWMCNVVWYDGVDAYVSKFVLKCDENGITEESEGLIGQYLNGNGELLKIDRLYPVTFENIAALKDSEDEKYKLAFDRFIEFYF